MNAAMAMGMPQLPGVSPDQALPPMDGQQRQRSRSRSPHAARFPATPEALTPASPKNDSTDGVAAESQTPEVIRRLIVISKEGNVEMTKEVRHRAELLNRPVRFRRIQQHQERSETKEDPPIGRQCGGAHFEPSQVQQAKEAIAALTQDIQKACKGQSASAQASLQLNVKFVEPIQSAADLVAKLQGLLGAKGPIVNVQPSEDASWRKPSTATWFAERKGDARNCVYRLNIPPDSTHKRPRNLSFQVAVGGRELTVELRLPP
eukprot:s10_g22.t1